MASKKPQRSSAFSEAGFKKTIEALKQEIVDLYLSDEIPWVVGYSGGKDSTAVLQLVWLALADLPEDERSKPVYVISTDTLVENPVVALWVSKSLDRMGKQAADQGLPLTAHRLTPAPENTFWVNLIGPGLPRAAPKVPLVHRAAENQSVYPVHQLGRPEARGSDPRSRNTEGRKHSAREGHGAL